MAKNIHEIRDPIHVFVRLDSYERMVLNSRPFQRLRHIHQLALTYLVYPGATHKRFEHSLGVMELAGRVFDVVNRPHAITDEIRDLLPEITREDELRYWRRVIRMAALCHDLGHLPFSHTGEDLLPNGWNHERLTMEIIRSDEMREIWEKMTPPLRVENIIKLAVGPKKAKAFGMDKYSDWEAILAEIIIGDAFGVDRMDYLLRDSYHAGVAYGKFDHYRLIDTLRILPPPPSSGDEASKEPMLGVEEGGLQSAEALLLARYFMFSQVYCHPIRRLYDIHLKDFLSSWLSNGKFPTDVEGHLTMTDNEVTSALRKASSNPYEAGYEHAERIICRKHFKVLYQRNPDDIDKNPEAVEAVYAPARKKYGEENVRIDRDTEKGGIPDFPVLARDSRIISSLSMSQNLERLPVVAIDYVFIDPEHRDRANRWLQAQREKIISVRGEEEG